MQTYLWGEFWRLLGIATVGVVLGLMMQDIPLGLLIVFFLYLIWHLYNLTRLARWMTQRNKKTVPSSSGNWETVFSELYHQQKRYRKRSKRLTEILNRFRETLAAMPDGVVILKQSGEIEWWNSAAGNLLKLIHPQDVTQRITHLFRQPDFVKFYNSFDNEKDFILEDVDEDLKLSIRIVPYGTDERLLMVRDVTLMQRVEQIRRDFVANVSHELRTPLTVLSGFIENLVDGGVSEEDLQTSLRLMEQQTDRMQRLVNDLITLSKLENSDSQEQRQEQVPVPEMLNNLLSEAKILSKEKEHIFNLDVDPNLYINGDAKELDSAFTNLIVNAINYTPAKGEITIRWYLDDKGAHYEVEDNGIGIAPYHVTRLTERFYRVDVARSRDSGGSGLGLAIVKHVLNRHQGRLRIESQLGKGSRFICDFPLECVIKPMSDRREQA